MPVLAFCNIDNVTETSFIRALSLSLSLSFSSTSADTDSKINNPAGRWCRGACQRVWQ